MPDISKEEREHFNHYLNEQLEEAIDRAIIDEEYGEIKGLIANDELSPINNKIYDLLFFDTYPLSPKLSLMLKNDDLQDVVSFFIKCVPKDFLCAAESKDSTPLITFIFHHQQDLIPNLLKVISESGRDDVIVRKDLVLSNESCAAYPCFSKNQDYYNAREAIKKYCIKNKDGNYEVIPDYILPIKNESRELQQCFKDVAINSNNLDEVKSTLGKIKNADKINVDSVNKVLCILAEQAKSDEEIARAISDCQADMTFPTGLENTSAIPPSCSIENTSATPSTDSIRRE